MFLNLLRLNLQYFSADTGSDGGQAGAGDQPGNDNNGSDNAGGQGPQNNNPGLSGDNGNAGDAGKPDKPEKTLTQEEVNNLIARETRRAQEKLLKQLGVKDFNSAKEGLDKFREYQESQLTEQEKIANRAKELEQTVKTFQEENSTLKAQLAAMKADVNPDSVNDVIVLANALVNEETDIDAAIKQVIEKYPHFKKQVADIPPSDDEGKKPQFSSGKHKKEPESELDKWLNAFKI